MLNNWEKYWGSNLKEGEDQENPEVAAERERRKRERGKKRYEEDSSFVNEEFFSSWKNRTNNFKSSFKNPGTDGENSLDTMFDGNDLAIDVEVDFAEVMQEGGILKNVTV